jgi:hypothetical protein
MEDAREGLKNLLLSKGSKSVIKNALGLFDDLGHGLQNSIHEKRRSEKKSIKTTKVYPGFAWGRSKPATFLLFLRYARYFYDVRTVFELGHADGRLTLLCAMAELKNRMHEEGDKPPIEYKGQEQSALMVGALKCAAKFNAQKYEALTSLLSEQNIKVSLNTKARLARQNDYNGVDVAFAYCGERVTDLTDNLAKQVREK